MNFFVKMKKKKQRLYLILEKCVTKIDGTWYRSCLGLDKIVSPNLMIIFIIISYLFKHIFYNLSIMFFYD